MMRRLLIAGAMSAALAGIGHNMPPSPMPPATFTEQMETSHRIKRAENKKLWQKVRRKPKGRAQYHRLNWSQRKGRL